MTEPAAINWADVIFKIRYGQPGYATLAEASQTLGVPVATVEAEIVTASGLEGSTGLLAKEYIELKNYGGALRAGGKAARAARALKGGIAGLSMGFWIALGIGIGVLAIGGYVYVNYGNTTVKPGSRFDQPAPTATLDSPTPEQSRGTADAAATIDLSGQWTMRWNWSVTDVYFVGTVSGGSGNYSFNGSLDHGGNAIWSPAKGSATADCTLSGQPDSSPATAQMTCSVTLPDGAWNGQSQGTAQTFSYPNGQTKFEYLGTGEGTNQKGETAHMDHLDLSPTTGQ